MSFVKKKSTRCLPPLRCPVYRTAASFTLCIWMQMAGIQQKSQKVCIRRKISLKKKKNGRGERDSASTFRSWFRASFQIGEWVWLSPILCTSLYWTFNYLNNFAPKKTRCIFLFPVVGWLTMFVWVRLPEGYNVLSKLGNPFQGR